MSGDFQNMENEENLPKKTISQPVYSFMQKLYEDYSTDPIKAQINSTTTYMEKQETLNIQMLSQIDHGYQVAMKHP